LLNPESIKEAIALLKCQESTKVTYVNSYVRFAQMYGLKFNKPRYRIDHQKIPFILMETELDQLIAGCTKR